jgi:hypothetical protein
MCCTSVRFRTPDNVPPDRKLQHLLYKRHGMLTERDWMPHQFDDGTWEVIFYATTEPEIAEHVNHVRDGRALLTDADCEIVSETDCTRPFSFSELVENLCKRPDMYTGRGTYDSVMDLLNGFSLGIAIGLGEPEAAQEATAEWQGFFVWLDERGIFSNYQNAYAGLRTGLRAAHSTDKGALDSLAELWAKYQADKRR